MSRLLVHVEGQTEESFVYEILAPHLYAVGYHAVGARIVGNARLRARRGGIRPWHGVKAEILRHLSQDTGCIATTMVDYYALPDSWPGRTGAGALPFLQRGPHVQAALLEDLAAASASSNRFEPFVLMHEFEALLFSDCVGFATGIGHPGKATDFQAVRNLFSSPEEINDSPLSAPSKRVEDIIPGYQKPLLGNLAAIEIGLARIRQECPHFDDWIGRLELRVPPVAPDSADVTQP